MVIIIIMITRHSNMHCNSSTRGSKDSDSASNTIMIVMPIVIIVHIVACTP